jgi:two-component system, LytTR family, sensor kinase
MKRDRWENRSIVWAIHVLVWAIILMLPFIFTHDDDGDGGRQDPGFKTLDTVTNFLWMGMFYLNALLLVPRFLYSKKYLLYTGCLIASFVVIMLLHGALFMPFAPGRHFIFLRSSQHNIIPFLFTVAVSTAYTIIYDKFTADAASNALQKETLKTELSFLRSQVSPHFLFNVLNNIVAMVRLKSDELEPTVIKLSSLLQYMLYESDDEKVLLKNEVDSLRYYIDLQKLRFSTQLQLAIQFNIKEDWHAIEPMLLIPFVENAFKHGNTFNEAPEIVLTLEVADNTLQFQVKNKYVEADKAKDKTSGIGLANVRRRLQLLYPGKHELFIDDRNGYYNVHLKLLLQ